ncbi:MAG: N-acetylmuramic acid 6-phosphate etherase [Flavobacteriales bacterium]|nr:N-acetylmuramic acid 6-phosphate etherase [Flavobacteriales bacterium]|tara:strand:+ start:133 stop:951 length:819 start_codon:yes stop_codon:yes gene_type:complete
MAELIMKKTTEQTSKYNDLQDMSVLELIKNINIEDQCVPEVIKRILPEIEVFVNEIIVKMKIGGRLFYIGAGTSGRLGILDASECPPTFGVSDEKVIGIIAGGDGAIRKAVEFAEDSKTQGWNDLKSYGVNTKDIVIGIAASGTTPYVVHALKKCNKEGILTGCITCNEKSPLASSAKFPITAIVGPEFVTGSTRMKAGTAQKLILNMISTTVMIKLGRVEDNKMVDMQLSNEKLVERGTKMIMEATGLDFTKAKKMLSKHGSVRKAIEAFN